MLRLRPTLSRALALFLGAFALYALTAQRGLGWGDSGEFQYRILTMGADGIVRGCDSFATAHPLYVALCKLVCSSPFHVTLVSAFFGALAVALFYLLARNLAVAALFALAHGLWWLSTVSEVYTLSLCFFAAELLALQRFRETGSAGALIALAALNGLHLEVHNLALLSIPVYAGAVWKAFRGGAAGAPSQHGHGTLPRQRRILVFAAACWILTASFWIWSFFALGPREVLFGSYGAQVLTLRPIMPAAIPINLALGALTLAVPAVLAIWRWRKGERRETRDESWSRDARRETRDESWSRDVRRATRDGAILALFAIHFLFWATYFIVSQYTFILPSALLAYLLVADTSRGRISVKCADCVASSRGRISPKCADCVASSRGRISVKCAVVLFALQLTLPVAAWGVLTAIGFPPEYRALHPGRNDPAYFALPWHFTDDSASRAAALQRTPWKGYP